MGDLDGRRVGLRTGTRVGRASPPRGVGDGRGLMRNCALVVGRTVGRLEGAVVIPVGMAASCEAVCICPPMAFLALGARVGNETGGGGIRVQKDMPFCKVRVPAGHASHRGMPIPAW